MKKQYKCFPKGCQAGTKQQRDHGMGAPGGNPYHKLDWQGGLGAFPSTHGSEKLKGNHNALGMRFGNCLNMRVSNCSGIKRVRTWNANIAGIKGEKIGHKTHIIEKWKQNLELYSGVWIWSNCLFHEEGNLHLFLPVFYSWLLFVPHTWAEREGGIPSWCIWA